MRLSEDQRLIHCYRCEAYYRPQLWAYGWERGSPTAPEFVATGYSRQNECPMCRKPPRLEPYPPPPLAM